MVLRGALGLLAAAALAGCGEVPGDAPEMVQTSNAASDVDIEIAGDPVAVAEVAGAQCAEGEEAVFSCKLANGKHVSVCGNLETKFAQYRYGAAGKAPDLVWPAKAADGKLDWASVSYSGGGEAQISFARGDTRYVIYSRVVRTNFTAGEPNNPAVEDGVLILKGGKQLADLKCDDGDVKPVDYDRAGKFADKADDLFFYGE